MANTIRVLLVTLLLGYRQKEAARAGRKDAKLKAVSISERHNKKAFKYNSTSLPYPFTSKEAFDGSMRQPLGSDFNSQHSFRSAATGTDSDRKITRHTISLHVLLEVTSMGD